MFARTKDLKPFLSVATVILLIAITFPALILAGCQHKNASVTTAGSSSNKISGGKQEATGTTQSELPLVTRVIDGDTIVISLGRKPYKVRLIGVDTPERGRPYYREATEKTKELLLGKKVRLEKDVSETDRYGRLLRYVYVDDTFVNAELVKQGYALPATFPPDVQYVELFRKLASEARNSNVGLWVPSTTGPSSHQTPPTRRPNNLSEALTQISTTTQIARTLAK